MAEVTIVYWRDIPAQLIVGKGRQGAKVQLSERFEQAIDRCAMRSDARDTDSYLAEWRKEKPFTREGEAKAIAKAEAELLENAYTDERLKQLIAQNGWETSKKKASE